MDRGIDKGADGEEAEKLSPLKQGLVDTAVGYYEMACKIPLVSGKLKRGLRSFREQVQKLEMDDDENLSSILLAIWKRVEHTLDKK
ncbi:hypothetical protein HN709_04715 [Candidatus Peregrinibacteria bacterium]|jgi:hypothetical protein|nr:hypothetical protein [Candidatus Peregrinibacteria bacterium]